VSSTFLLLLEGNAIMLWYCFPILMQTRRETSRRNREWETRTMGGREYGTMKKSGKEKGTIKKSGKEKGTKRARRRDDEEK